MTGKYKILLSFAVLCLLSAPALANQPQLIGTFGKWDAYTLQESAGKVCYMISTPDSAKGNYTSRGDVYALVTHRPGEGTKNVFSYITGYTYKTASNVTLKVDSSSFLLFTQGDTAWAADADTDNKITEALRRGSRLVVTGTSSRGTLTTDTFGLSGSGAAYNAITKACGQ